MKLHFVVWCIGFFFWSVSVSCSSTYAADNTFVLQLLHTNFVSAFAAPRWATIVKYGKQELLPPSPAEIPAAIGGALNLVKSATTFQWRKLTVRVRKWWFFRLVWKSETAILWHSLQLIYLSLWPWFIKFVNIAAYMKLRNIDFDQLSDFCFLRDQKQSLDLRPPSYQKS